MFAKAVAAAHHAVGRMGRIEMDGTPKIRATGAAPHSGTWVIDGRAVLDLIARI